MHKSNGRRKELKSFDLRWKYILISYAILAVIMLISDIFKDQLFLLSIYDNGIPRIQRETPDIAKKLMHYLHYLGGGRELAFINIMTLLIGSRHRFVYYISV